MNPASTAALAVFTLTMFTSATLLFLVQLLVAKIILPKFGGTPAVWITCSVFFQAALLAGYYYAHVLTSKLNTRRQVVVHLVLVLSTFVAFFFFPLGTYQGFEPPDYDSPALYVLLLVALLIGLPFFVVSTSAPLFQRWFSQTGHHSAKDPYFLYAASNLGSMAALVSYPVLVEPYFRVDYQGWFWMACYGMLAALAVMCGFLVLRAQTLALAAVGGPLPSEDLAAKARSEQITEKPTALPPGEEPGSAAGTEQITEKPIAPPREAPALEQITEKPTAPRKDASAKGGDPTLAQPPTLVQKLFWIGLGFVPSSLMLGVTIYMTMDIAAIPLLWVLPLILYLLSFILVFSKATSALHPLMVMAMPVAVLLSVFLTMSDTHPWIGWQFLLHLATLFIVAMVCHGELARNRPAPQYLTSFYLCMSVGGFLGGIFNLIAPMLFFTVAEYPLVLTLACLLLPVLASDSKADSNRALEIGMLVLLAFVGAFAAWHQFRDWRDEDMTGNLFPPLPPLPGLNPGPWHIVLLVGLGLAAIGYVALGKRNDLPYRILDLVLPVGLGLVTARFLWHPPVYGRWLEWPWEAAGAEAPDFLRLTVVFTCTFLVAICYGFSMRPVRFALGVGLMTLVGAWYNVPTDVLCQERSFFCVYRVQTARNGHGVPQYTKLVHGTTMHGQQRVDTDAVSILAALTPLGSVFPLDAAVQSAATREALRDLRIEPLTYFHKTGPIGQMMDSLVRTPNDKRPIAVLGLGTGTLAGYILPGQDVVFYEIDPLAVQIAKDPRFFTYLSDCRGNVDVILGDGRLKLKEAPNGKFRMLFMDAFSSDSIPVHLVTREAVQLYFEKLTDDGVLVVNVSNRYLEPAPVLANIGKELGLVGLTKWDSYYYWGQITPGKASSDWVIMARKWQDLEPILERQRWARQAAQVNGLLGMGQSQALAPALFSRYWGWETLQADPSKPTWTDDFSNLLSILK
jgi:spermidine synthase